MSKPHNAAAETQKRPSEFARFIKKLLLIWLITICMGFIFILGAMVSHLLIMIVCAGACTDYSTFFLISFSMAIIMSTLAGMALLRYMIKSHWATSIAAPLISLAAMCSVTVVAMSFYGENFLGYPATIIIFSFPILLIALTFLFDSITKWKYPVAALLLICSIFVLPVIVAETGQIIRVKRNTQRVTAAAEQASVAIYSPSYIPYGAKLISADSRSYLEFKYELNYSTKNKFNPYAFVLNPETKTFQITGSAYKQDMVSVCNGIKPEYCQKIGNAKHCTVHRSDQATYHPSAVDFYCVKDKTLLSLWGNTKITNEEAIKIFDSLQSGITKTNNF